MKPEEVTPKLRKIFDDASPITDNYDQQINAGIAAVVTHLECAGGRGQLPPLTEVPEYVRAVFMSEWPTGDYEYYMRNALLAAINACRATPAEAVFAEDAKKKMGAFFDSIRPTPAEATGDGAAESISRLLEIKSFPGVCCGTAALCDYLIAELRKVAGDGK